MTLTHSFRLLARQEQPLVEQAPTTAEDTRQLDLLLQELHQHEQQLGPDYWGSKAQEFANRVALKESHKPRRPSRYAQLKPYLTSLLPIGGLLALGLAFSEPRVELVAAPLDTASAAAMVAHNERATLAHLADGPMAIPKISVADVSSRYATTHHFAKSTGIRNSETQQRTARPPLEAHTSARKAPLVLAREAPTTFASTPSSSDAHRQVAMRHATPHEAGASHAAASPIGRASEADTFVEQLQALKRADKALKLGANSSAKNALARRFSPQFLLHAQALRAVLQCQTHDLSTGKRYLAAQTKTHPNSPYLDRIRRACGVKAR